MSNHDDSVEAGYIDGDDIFYDSREDTFQSTTVGLPTIPSFIPQRTIPPTPRPRSTVVVGSSYPSVTPRETLSAETVIDDAYNRCFPSSEPQIGLNISPVPTARSKLVRINQYPDSLGKRLSRPNQTVNKFETTPCVSDAYASTGLPVLHKPRAAESAPKPLHSSTSAQINSNTEDMLRTLVNEFTHAIEERSTSNVVKSTLKTPRFDGTGDVHLFIQQYNDVCALSGWEERVALAQLRGALDKGAKEAGRADSVKEVFRRLLYMFGLLPEEAREKLHQTRREPGESYMNLGNRVGRLARLSYGGLGSEVESTLAVEAFDRALDDPALRQYISLAKVNTLDGAVKAAERYVMLAQVPPKPAPRLERSARVAVVDSTPDETSRFKAGCPKPDKFETLLASFSQKLDAQTKQIEEQSRRLALYEQGNRRQTDNLLRPNSSSNRVNAEKNSRACYQCGSTSHFKRECPQLTSAKSKNSSNSEN